MTAPLFLKAGDMHDMYDSTAVSQGRGCMTCMTCMTALLFLKAGDMYDSTAVSQGRRGSSKLCFE